MEIRTLKKYEYKGSNIYIRNFGSTFEYIITFKGDVYTSHVDISRTFSQRLLGKDYTEKQLKDVISYLMLLAQSTIDFLLGEKPEKKE